MPSAPSTVRASGRVVEQVGFVESVTRPGHGVAPRFTAELATAEPAPGQISSTGRRLRLVWIGQRVVPGILPGRRLRIRGFVSDQDGMSTVYNPRFDLLPKVLRD